MINRVEPGFYEEDVDGYMMASDEADEYGRAVGIALALRVEFPWNQGGVDDAALKRAADYVDFNSWIETRYSGLDFIWGGADLIEAEVYDDHRQGETSSELVERLAATDDYLRLKAEGNVFYTLRDAWAEYAEVNLYEKGAGR